MANLNDKFKDIRKDHPHVKLEPVNEVYETISTCPDENGITITAVSDKSKLERNSVARIVKLLKDYKYVGIGEGSTYVPFLMVIGNDQIVNYERGKIDIGNAMDDNLELLLDHP